MRVRASSLHIIGGDRVTSGVGAQQAQKRGLLLIFMTTTLLIGSHAAANPSMHQVLLLVASVHL
jgi:hypothetical protein